MIKLIQTLLTQYGLQYTLRVIAKIYICYRQLSIPHINQKQNEDPYHINKVPIQDSQVKSSGTSGLGSVKIKQAN
jgi:hypothetical protein